MNPNDTSDHRMGYPAVLDAIEHDERLVHRLEASVSVLESVVASKRFRLMPLGHSVTRDDEITDGLTPPPAKPVALVPTYIPEGWGSFQFHSPKGSGPVRRREQPVMGTTKSADAPTWKAGPPPTVGWYIADRISDFDAGQWARYWNGSVWGLAVRPDSSYENKEDRMRHSVSFEIHWLPGRLTGADWPEAGQEDWNNGAPPRPGWWRVREGPGEARVDGSAFWDGNRYTLFISGTRENARHGRPTNLVNLVARFPDGKGTWLRPDAAEWLTQQLVGDDWPEPTAAGPKWKKEAPPEPGWYNTMLAHEAAENRSSAMYSYFDGMDWSPAAVYEDSTDSKLRIARNCVVPRTSRRWTGDRMTGGRWPDPVARAVSQ